MCKIVFSITFNVSFWCSKEPSHREHQTCLSENIKVDLRIISKLTSKLDIKKAGQGWPASEMPFVCHDLQNEKIDR